jgi:hypothetical protein
MSCHDILIIKILSRCWKWTYVNNFNNCPTRCDFVQFLFPANCSTCFGWHLHPSSQVWMNCNYSIWHWSNCMLPTAVVQESVLNRTVVEGSELQKWVPSDHRHTSHASNTLHTEILPIKLKALHPQWFFTLPPLPQGVFSVRIIPIYCIL